MTPRPQRQARGNWTRELVELAALFLAAGAVSLAATGAHALTTGPTVLLSIGAALLLAAAIRWFAKRPPQPAPPAPEPMPDTDTDVRQALWRLRASVTDAPGRLARLAGGLAALGGDIRTMQVHPVADGAVDEVLLHVPGRTTRWELIEAVEAAGGRDVVVARADVRELDDVPTRTANLATDLVNGRTDLVRALSALLGRVEIRWQEEGSCAGEAMCLAAPGGGELVLERPGGSFTPAEFARASAMVELEAACRTRILPAPDEIRTSGGVELTIRAADRADVALVAEFHERCSSAARYRRYFSPGPAPGVRGLQRLLTPALGRALLAVAPNGDVVGMGNLMYDGDTGELALLVRDDWQRRGVGAALAGRLVEQARQLDLRTLTAHTHVDNTAIARTLRRAGLKLVGAPEPGEWRWSRELQQSQRFVDSRPPS
ncbi:L-amino acid N-acyltransferase YncA [Saccharopolyspora antimicrobica]|uniref:L-amino acid N-acyltransferase YncA n=1 Tax=Saccharopolyspora antimicrobica TaxID=455193 RepID=A0A1I5H3D6_9PSEU|nr:GNAT family N-acetyltransferase [Saccharopolyspora antimicrobica]RKT90115.1 L-amino acid N-acyltransferase YncA [Saccharopolyspora antimicrobica]SFO42717.1 L-amino acid N-acyltransferase YncA [Saccharopolyspora antimicrobica]